jgi:soluble lytic murein transglycosylase
LIRATERGDRRKAYSRLGPVVNLSLTSRAQAHLETRSNETVMRILRVDRRIAGAAFAAACCLLLPTQQKPVGWIMRHARHFTHWAPKAPAPVDQAGEAPPAPAQETPKQPADALGYDLTGAAEALRLYREGQSEAGDAALTTHDPLVRAAVEWTFLRDHPIKAGLERIAGFMRAHPEWPLSQMRKHAEDLASVESARAERVAAYFSEFPPMSTGGEIAFADLLRSGEARRGEAERMAREIWREAELPQALEKRLLKTFASILSPADHIYRADRLMLREETAAAGRAATLAGKDGQALFRVQADLASGVAWAKLAPKVPAALRDDPALLFARIHAARHAEHIDEAAKLMLGAPHGVDRLLSPDDWWTERRLLARKLLDAKDYARAYKIAAEHSAASEEARIEAEFHAGWIALRFLDDPALAAPHFETMALLARKPHSVARAAYWRGRVAEALGEDGKVLYARAAAEIETFYGQLARAKLGDETIALRTPPEAAEGATRSEPIRAAELLFALGESDAGRELALDSMHILRDGPQIAALSKVIEHNGDAHMALIAGKEALHRGMVIDSLAYPLNGVPEFVALGNSAPRSLVLAIARQESAFDVAAHSGAGALGLMQMIPGTAKGAAHKAGVAYDENRLKSDPAFNAQLGAYFLGELMGEYGGSHILTFAAYNAGGGNVRDWIEAYGDPRDPNVDPIDWIERIPFTETRNYVQRIVENLQVYRARLGVTAPNIFTADLRQKLARGE